MAHQVQVRVGAASRRAGCAGGAALRSAAEAAAWAALGAGVASVAASCAPTGWTAFAVGATLSGLVAAAIGGRSGGRFAAALSRLTDAVRRAAEGQCAPISETAGGDIGRLAAAVNHLLVTTHTDRADLVARLCAVQQEMTEMAGAAAKREAESSRRVSELQAQVASASRSVRESALSIRAQANLLMRDCGSRMEASARERLEQVRTHADVLDAEVRELLEAGSRAEGAAAGE